MEKQKFKAFQAFVGQGMELSALSVQFIHTVQVLMKATEQLDL